MKRVLLVAFLCQPLSACQVQSEVGSNALTAVDARPDAIPFPACSDRLDNDDDGRIDYPYDPGCSHPGDSDESSPDLAPRCLNQVDDDADGIIDFPLDPGCLSASGESEVDPATPPECSDEADNDSDGLIDYPEDPGCLSAGDLDENTVAG